MSGTKQGGKKAKLKNIELYGEDFYSRIGAMGGRNGHTGGFASDPNRAREAGRKGGLKSSRKGIKNGQRKEKIYCPVWKNEETAYTPEKVEKLEADEYLLEKALKAQENAWARMRKQHLMRLAQERATKHNKLVKRRKIERQNRKGGRK